MIPSSYLLKMLHIRDSFFQIHIINDYCTMKDSWLDMLIVVLLALFQLWLWSAVSNLATSRLEQWGKSDCDTYRQGGVTVVCITFKTDKWRRYKHHFNSQLITSVTHVSRDCSELNGHDLITLKKRPSRFSRKKTRCNDTRLESHYSASRSLGQ